MSNTNHGWGPAAAAGREISTGGSFSVGQALNQAVIVFGRSPLQFILLTALAFVPIYIVQLSMGRGSGASVGGAVALFVQVVVYALSNAMCLFGAYQVMRGRPFTAGESLSVGLRRFGPVLGTSLLSGLLVVLGIIALIVPGVIIAMALYVALPICVIERLGAASSLRRSRELTKGYRWQIFGLYLVVLVITWIVTFGIFFIISRAAGPFMAQLVGLVFEVLSGAFGAVLNAVVYYNLRSVKEGVDIEQLASVFD